MDSFSVQTTWNDIVRVNGHYLAKKVKQSSTIVDPLRTIEVEQIDPTLGVDESALIPPVDAKAMPPPKVSISSAVMAGNKISGSDPIYPALAKSQFIQGTVVIQAIIGKDGAGRDLQVLSGPPELGEESLNAIKAWRYRPYLLNGQPVEVETTINSVFSMGH